MKSVVINADTGWDFSRNVWLYALDTYRHGGDTLFWTLGPEPPGPVAASFWGGFPENFDRDQDALVEECAELAGALVGNAESRLAVILVLNKTDFQAYGASPAARTRLLSPRGETGLRALEKILSEVDRQSSHAAHSVTEARARLWSAVAVRGAGDADRDGETARQLLARLGPASCRVNTAFLLSQGRLQDEATTADEPAFLKLRLILELMGNTGRPASQPDAWRRFRRDPSAAISAQRSTYWVQMPDGGRPVALASDSLRRILIDWSNRVDLQRHDGQPNLEVQERIAGLVQDLQPLDQTAIDSRLSLALAAPPASATGPDAPPDIPATLDHFARSSRRRWLHNDRALAEIEAARTQFPRDLQAYAGRRIAVEQIELDRLAREASKKRRDVADSLESITISAGEKGRREVEAPVTILRQRREQASNRAAAAGQALRTLTDKQQAAGPQFDAALTNLAAAEQQLLKPAAVWTFWLLVGLFLAPAILHNLIVYIADPDAASAGAVQFVRHALAYSLWIVCPIFGFALLVGLATARRLSNKRAQAHDQVMRLLTAQLGRIDTLSVKRIEVRLARDDAAIFQLAIDRLQPRETQQDINARRYFIGEILVSRPAAAATGIPEVDEKVQTLAGHGGRLLGRSDGETNPVPTFLSKHGFTIDGTLTVNAPFLSGGSLDFANHASWRGQINLADPGA